MTGEQLEKIVRPLIAQLYPGYTGEDYARLAAKCRATYEEWAAANYTGARKAHNVKVINVPSTPPRYTMRLSFEAMGRLKTADFEWTDTRKQAKS